MRNKVIGKDPFSQDEIIVGEEYDIDMIQHENLLGKTVPIRIKGVIKVSKFEYNEIEVCQCCGQELPEDKKRFKNQSLVEGTVIAVDGQSYLKRGDCLSLRFNKAKESKF